jgi:hypothetical protein
MSPRNLDFRRVFEKYLRLVSANARELTAERRGLMVDHQSTDLLRDVFPSAQLLVEVLIRERQSSLGSRERLAYLLKRVEVDTECFALL